MTVPAETTPSATLILLRDGPDGLELLMIRRHANMRFAPGAMVFPGGCLDPQDGVGGGDQPHRIAAIRETFEETGILLARRREGGRNEDGPFSERELAAFHADGAPGFLERVRAAGLALATDRLVPFAHWLTPEVVRRRFDTRFFLAPAPVGQDPRVDGTEAVSALWATPRAILDRADAGELRLIFVTRMNLLRLAGCATVDEALAAARRQPIVTVLPARVDTPGGPVFRIPEGAGYSPTEIPADQVRLG